MGLNKTTYKGFNIYYYNRQEFNILLEEVFEKESYFFSAQSQKPKIIDCGSHIGLSILYFKMLYPDAEILAFEPDKITYQILKKNVESNQLKGVQLYNYALSDVEGEEPFYGESEIELDSCGNTLNRNWGDRFGFIENTANSVLLSSYLKDRIDFLKMDIEGAEIKVLKEIEHLFPLIHEIAIEYHIYDRVSKKALNNTLKKIKMHFNKVEFTYSSLAHIMPERYVDWVSKYDPSIYKITGKND